MIMWQLGENRKRHWSKFDKYVVTSFSSEADDMQVHVQPFCTVNRLTKETELFLTCLPVFLRSTLLNLAHIKFSPLQYCTLLNRNIFRFRSGSRKLQFVVILPCIAIFKNIVYSLEPGETPSYSASHQTPSYLQCS